MSDIISVTVGDSLRNKNGAVLPAPLSVTYPTKRHFARQNRISPHSTVPHRNIMRHLCVQLAHRNVRINIVSPSYIESPMADAGAQSEAVQKMIDNIPLGRLGKPEDVANLVMFLASDRASYISGQVIRVNGGLIMGH